MTIQAPANLHPTLAAIASKDQASSFEWLLFVTGGYWIDNDNRLHHYNQQDKVLWKPIPENDTQPVIHPRSIIQHTNGGYNTSRSLWGWISRADVNGEPHLQLALDGQIEQYMRFNRRADCNYSANSYVINNLVYGAISWETQDKGSVTLNTTPWTLDQLDSLIRVDALLCITYGIACSQPAVWNASGIGHHSLFPFQGIGYPAWTNVKGKTCPGAARIAQMDYIRSEVLRHLALFIEHTTWGCRAS